ncbi:MAG: PmoA family protein [Saprospiraceae bacterium]|nr:PmoA family protein [Saprospiraceae bacterium]
MTQKLLGRYKIALILIFLVAIVCSCRDVARTVILDRDLHAHFPVALQMKDVDMDNPYEIVHSASGASHKAQVSPDSLLHFVPSVSMNRSDILLVNKLIGDGDDNRVQVENNDKILKVRSRGKEILSYHKEVVNPPDSLASHYQRSGFIHPLYSPDGQVLTEDFPNGHEHQHGIFHAFVKTRFSGTDTDFWNQAKEQGTVRHKEVLTTISGPVFGQAVLNLEHVAYLPEDTIVVLDEEWIIDIFTVDKGYILDFQIETRCHTQDSLLIDSYHYGGFAFRANDAWNVGAGAYDSIVFFTTSDGLSQKDANHTRPHWSAMHGQIEGKNVGVAIMGHPQNYRHPQPIRVHPVMPYFCFAPMVLGPYAITPDQSYTNRYRLLAFDGSPDTAWIAAAYSSFSK